MPLLSKDTKAQPKAPTSSSSNSAGDNRENARTISGSASSGSVVLVEAAERRCLASLVSTVDGLFTAHASPHVSNALWSTDDGVGDEDTHTLTAKLRGEIAVMPPHPLCSAAVENGDDDIGDDIGDDDCNDDEGGSSSSSSDDGEECCDAGEDDCGCWSGDEDGEKDDNGGEASLSFSSSPDSRASSSSASSLTLRVEVGDSSPSLSTSSPPSPPPPPSPFPAPSSEWPGWDSAAQRRMARRVASALVRAASQGRSANFKVTESAADQLLRFLTPNSVQALVEAGGPCGSLVALLTGIALTALVSAVVADALIHRLLGGTAHARHRKRDLLSRYLLRRQQGGGAGDEDDEVGGDSLLAGYGDCACRLCSGDVHRGESIGKGGFGEVFLCHLKGGKNVAGHGASAPSAAANGGSDSGEGADLAATSEEERDGRQRCRHVVKMIRADFERDVTVLQDALDEAKNLLSLEHDHIVRYTDVFVHRDVAALRNRRRRSLYGLSPRRQTATNKDDDDDDCEKDKNDYDDANDSSKDDANNEDESLGCDFICIVMEYCAGGTLLEHVAEGVPIPLDVTVNIVRQMVCALAYMHSRHLVHFDIKLENIFLAAAASPPSPSLNTPSLNSSSDKKTKSRRRRRHHRHQNPQQSHHDKKNEQQQHQQQHEQDLSERGNDGGGGGYVVKVGDFGLAMRRANRPLSQMIFSPHASSASLSSSSFFPKTSITLPSPSSSTSASSISSSLARCLARVGNQYQEVQRNVISLPRQKMSRRSVSSTGAPVSTATATGGVAVMCHRRVLTQSNDDDVGTEQQQKTCDSESGYLYPGGLMFSCERGIVAGTAPYQPPECFREGTDVESLGAEVDVWALGCIIYEAVTCTSLPLEPPYLGQLALRRRQQHNSSSEDTSTTTKEKIFTTTERNDLVDDDGVGLIMDGDGATNMATTSNSSDDTTTPTASVSSNENIDGDAREDGNASSNDEEELKDGEVDGNEEGEKDATDDGVDASDEEKDHQGGSRGSGKSLIIWEDVFADMLQNFDEQMESMVTFALADDTESFTIPGKEEPPRTASSTDTDGDGDDYINYDDANQDSGDTVIHKKKTSKRSLRTAILASHRGLRDLMVSCLNPDARKRPNLVDIVAQSAKCLYKGGKDEGGRKGGGGGCDIGDRSTTNESFGEGKYRTAKHQQKRQLRRQQRKNDGDSTTMAHSVISENKWWWLRAFEPEPLCLGQLTSQTCN